ncbi:DNA mismatch repair protein PMS1 [Dichanthelium oligosanthes]|uniref:DNA mismatch repair protein PMS1 n=1 Tax=Dichanthelium oligosanthes TaxID=888268 RepID=A0A1E5WIE3_9POAL|nr:DNA mismatch repair protein PMS1 [Dichanthelium oligosanthes]
MAGGGGGGGRGGSSPAIKPISKAVVHRICSGQVIFDLSSAVKELVENSLDAGATSVEVSLKAYGEERFKVADNGCGISPANFQALALKHHTSKISNFSDLGSVVTFGFRGEALSSLCALGKLMVETRTKDEPVGTHLEFEHSGVVAGERKTARQIGTTVTVEKLFSTLPVRSKEFSRNIRKEYGKVISLLNAYALIAKGVRLLCTNTVGKNSKMVVLRTQGSSSMKDNIITVFGLNTFKCLEPFSVTISDGCRVEGFLSKPGPGTGRNSGDRQFFYVNGRPVDMPKVTKLVNELYRSSNAKQYPVAILDFRIPTTSYDVNVAPDKRKIFFSSESTILQSLREAVENLYSPQQCSFSINHVEDPEKKEDTVTDGHNEDTNLIAAENVSSPDNSDDMEETDSEDQVSPENQKEPSSATKVAIDATSRDTVAQTDRSAWIPSFSYEQTKRSPKEGKGYASGANHFRTGLAAKSTHSSTSQSSLMNFVSLNKRKHEDDCNLISEAPVLRRGTCLEQVRRTSLEANFVSPNKQNYTDDRSLISETPVLRRGTCSEQVLISETPVLRRGTCSEQVGKTSLEGNSVSPNKQKHEDNCSLISETPVLRRGACSEQVTRTSLEASPAGLSSSTSSIPECNLPLETNSLKQHSPQSFVSVSADVSPQHSKPPNTVIRGAEVSSPCDVRTTEPDVEKQDDRCLSISGVPKKYSEVEHRNTLTDSPSPDAHDSTNGAAVRSPSIQYPIMQFTVAELRRRRKNGFMISHANKANCLEKATRCYKAATLDIYVPLGDEAKSNSLAAATNELDRLFSKDDFGEMEVVGQFNLGFIIGKLDQDLFIVDQHAADEKYNFEGLSQSTILNIQPLLQPLRLDLSPEEEVTVSMNMSTIRKNGFVLEEDLHASPGNHYLLKAVPFSKNITFGVQDVKELISMLADSQGDCSIISSYKVDKTDSVCPSRVRAMLASRACRMSTMIGDPLTKAEMRKILKNLTGLRSPWNCPHGRPTMRHLVDLRAIKNKGES